MRTGFNQGPKSRLVENEGGKLMMDFNKGLVDSIKDSVDKATWLKESDEGAVMTAILLAETLQDNPERRHQIAPILIGLLSNLGLISGSRKVGVEELTTAQIMEAMTT